MSDTEKSVCESLQTMVFTGRMHSCHLAVMAAAVYNYHLKLAAKICTSTRWM